MISFSIRPGYNQQTRKTIKMKFTKIFRTAIIITAAAGTVGICSAQNSASAAVTTTSTTQSTAPYTEGGVWQITMVKTKPGMGDDYLKALAKIFKATNDEAKRQGIITDYKILAGDAATQQDYDILLMIEYPTWPRWMVSAKRPTRSALKWSAPKTSSASWRSSEVKATTTLNQFLECGRGLLNWMMGKGCAEANP